MSTSRTDVPTVMHRAARTEDAVNRALARLMYRRGWLPRVIPYAGYGTDGWVRVLGRVLLAPPGTGGREDVAVRGWRHFVSAKLAGVPVAIDVAGQQHVVECGRGGYVDVTVPASLPPGWHTAEMRVAGSAVAEAPVRVVGPQERLGVISDIDDTVLVTALPRPFLAFWNTFVRHEESRNPVPGMAQLYRTVTRDSPEAFVVYVSTGAWNVAPALLRFLRRRGFPDGPLLLTDWGPTPEGWFRSGQDHKRRTLRRLMDELPQLRWVLVGDDGQHDPALYEELVWARPERVRLVLIRELGATEQVLTHGTPTPLPGQRSQRAPVGGHDQTGAGPSGSPRTAEARGPRVSGACVPWLSAPNGDELVAELRRRGITIGAPSQPDG